MVFQKRVLVLFMKRKITFTKKYSFFIFEWTWNNPGMSVKDNQHLPGYVYIRTYFFVVL